jgi:acyl-CoA thioesterase I
MRILVTSILLFLSLPGWGGTILVFGDSLSAGYGVEPGSGWVDLLKQRLSEKQLPYQVVNASISGDTSAGGLSRIDAELKRRRPNILILELGANDGLRGLPLKLMKNNLSSIVQKAKASGAQVLLVGMQMPPNYGPRYTERFSAIYGELAEKQQLPLVPFLLKKVALDPALMQPDNLHPNAKGQPLLLEAVWPVLKPMLTAHKKSVAKH